MIKLEHVALWTRNLEDSKNFYCRFFNGRANQKYLNPQKKFESYFISFPDGGRLEIMSCPDIPENKNDTVSQQHLGLIHLAFGVATKEEVDQMASTFREAGLIIISGPRKTGDGYYEFETMDPDQNRLEVTTKWTG